MAPAKCSYLIFTKSSQSEPSKILLELFGEKIPVNESPTFLGIRFDPGLTFKNQIDYLKETCTKRMNILKIVSCKKWGLSIETRLIIYKSLIRSIMEYSAIIQPCLTSASMQVLNTIQNNCLKIICNKSKYSSTTEILQTVHVEALEFRFDNLNTNYIRNCLDQENELIVDLFMEYKNFVGARTVKYQTLFCKYFNQFDV